MLKVQELGSFLFLISGFPFQLGKMSHMGVDTSEMSHVSIAGKCLLLRDVRRHQAKIGYAEVESCLRVRLQPPTPAIQYFSLTSF